MSKSWKTIRVWLLAVVCISAFCILSKSIFHPPTAQEVTVTPYNFPTTVPLSEWQQVENGSAKKIDDPSFVSSHNYRYQKNNLSLDIQVYYLIRTGGDVNALMQNYILHKQKPDRLTIVNAKGGGFYGFIVQNERAFLSACINPQGNSTVTADHFRTNRNTHDFKLSRLLPWLLGKSDVRDWRCLWTVFSLPLEKTTPQDANSILESAWTSWHQWWQPRFPPS